MMEEEHPRNKKPDADPLPKELAEQEWRRMSGARPILSGECQEIEVEEEAKWVGATITGILNTHAKQLRISARSKRWWNDTIKEMRKGVSDAKRQRRQGRAGKQAVEEARRMLHRTINREKRQMWQQFLQNAERDQCWVALRYCSPWASSTTPAIRDQMGGMAVTLEEKEVAFRQSAFPPPPGGQHVQLPLGGMAGDRVTKETIKEAILGQSVKKAPGPDRLTFRAIRLIWEWDPDRIIALVCFFLFYSYSHTLPEGAWQWAKYIINKGKML
jgi:hypothetical protein